MTNNNPISDVNTVKLLGGRIIIPIADKRLLQYSKHEVYVGFDDCTSVNDVVTLDDIEASKRIFSMIDQHGYGESAEILSSAQIRSWLEKVPDADIAQITDAEWASIKKDIRGLLASFLSISHVGLAKGGKIIHLKRPHLVPILDSYVVNLLTGVNPGNVYSKSSLLNLGMHALEIARDDIRNNPTFFSSENKMISDLPIPISFARIYDILCWTHWKWDLKELRKTTRWIRTANGYRRKDGYLEDEQ